MKLVKKSFFKKNTIDVAKGLLGKYIVKDGMVGRIVETEAYLSDDPASHSFVGRTARNYPMFGKAGKSYVYFTYGMYFCFNVATGKEGIGEAVLIRAVEPISGIEKMKKNRGIENEKNLCNGPAKFCMAFGIDKKHNDIDLLNKSSPVKLMEGKEENFEIVETTRVGISKAKERPHRFYIKGNNFVSRK